MVEGKLERERERGGGRYGSYLPRQVVSVLLELAVPGVALHGLAVQAVAPELRAGGRFRDHASDLSLQGLVGSGVPEECGVGGGGTER